MDTLLYALARALVALLQALPLTWVARLGRGWAAALAYWLDARHRRVALRNLTLCFGAEKSPAELRALARENFRRIGENFACAVKTAAMSFDELRPHVEFVGNPRIVSPPAGQTPQSVVAAIGHFGNFELYARFGQFAPGLPVRHHLPRPAPAFPQPPAAIAARALRLPLLRAPLRCRSAQGLHEPARRHARPAGRPVRPAPCACPSSATTAPPPPRRPSSRCATIARCITGICYRVGLARWRIEAGAEIPTRENGQPRSTAAIMRDVNRAFEAAVRRDPANWFWVHSRWKPARQPPPDPKPPRPIPAATASAGPGARACRIADGAHSRDRPSSTLPPPPRRILVRGVNWLGDAVMTTPALQRLREALPEAHITLLTPEKLADLWQHHPEPRCGDDLLPGREPRGRSLAACARGTFDTALVLPNSPRSALEVWLARIPQRIGYARPWRNWLLTQAARPAPGQGADAQALRQRNEPPDPPARSPRRHPPLPAARPRCPSNSRLPSPGGRSGRESRTAPAELEVTAAKWHEAEEALLSDWRNQHAPPRPAMLSVGLIPARNTAPPNAGRPSASPPSRAKSPGQIGNCLWLAFGGAGDWQLCDDIARLAGGAVLNLAGKTSLRQLMALLKLCRVVLTNDTGPMHVAAALGTPVVVPFGSTSPELTGPGLPGDPRHRLLKSAAPCSPCFRRACPIDFRCMTGISPERVVEAVSQAISLP